LYWVKKIILKLYGKIVKIKGATNKEFSLYASHSEWNSEEDFWNWTKLESFRLAHKDAASHRDLYLGPPDYEGFEVII
jgi:heme-degrading monooxygenase HmoA